MDRIPGFQRSVIRWIYTGPRTQARLVFLSLSRKGFNHFRKPESQMATDLDEWDLIATNPIVNGPDRHLQFFAQLARRE